METVKREVSWLESFPPDVWAYFVCYLPGEQIGRLMMTGATILLQRLKSPKVVKSIKLGSELIAFKSWPMFLNDVPSLEELSINICTTDRSFVSSLRLESIPAGLKKLELDGILNESDTHLGLFEKDGTILKLSDRLPHLETLVLGVDIWDHSWMVHSPRNLTKLSLFRWDGTVKLPSSLIHFESLDSRLITSSFVPQLPSSLESFEARWLTGVELVCPLLPPSIRKLAFGSQANYSDGPRSSKNLLESLPKSLTHFEIPNVLEINFETTPRLISLLPMTLTELHIHPNFPCSAWYLLPQNLKILRVSKLVANHKVDQKVQSFPFDSLPRSITKLELLSLDRHFCGPPSVSDHSYFPPKLTHLKIPRIQLSPETAKLLPNSLTHLEIGNLCERVCEHLKTGLKTLQASETLMSPNLINFLPQSLTFLDLAMLKDSSQWYDYSTGERINPTSKQEYSIHQKCLSDSFDWKGIRLPPTLTLLDLTHVNELGDSLMLYQQLPNLVELMLQSAKNFTDSSIPFLPRHLTVLGLQSSSGVTGSSFQFLPRYLIHLNLSSSQSIFDSDIQHLPRTLKEAHLSEAIHLTDLCIPDLPPHLEELNLDYNSQITTSSFPYLPHTLQSRRLFRSVELANAYIDQGVVHQKK